MPSMPTVSRPHSQAQFLQCAWGLSAKGVLVINLAGERERYAGLVAEVMQVFDDQVLMIPVPDGGNHILLAFANAISSRAGAGCTTMPRNCAHATASIFPTSCASWSVVRNHWFSGAGSGMTR